MHISVLDSLSSSVCSPVIDFLLTLLVVVSRARLSLVRFLAPLFSGLLYVSSSSVHLVFDLIVSGAVFSGAVFSSVLVADFRSLCSSPVLSLSLLLVLVAQILVPVPVLILFRCHCRVKSGFCR
jgi:hypothetical protein